MFIGFVVCTFAFYLAELFGAIGGGDTEVLAVCYLGLAVMCDNDVILLMNAITVFLIVLFCVTFCCAVALWIKECKKRKHNKNDLTKTDKKCFTVAYCPYIGMAIGITFFYFFH